MDKSWDENYWTITVNDDSIDFDNNKLDFGNILYLRGVSDFQNRVLEMLKENYEAAKIVPEWETDTSYKQDVLIETYEDLISIVQNLKAIDKYKKV